MSMEQEISMVAQPLTYVERLDLQNRKLPGSGGQADATYVSKIHEMLEAAETEGFQNIVSWLPNGRGFKIHNKKEFEESIMPRYFKAKIQSFMRWLRAWGFERCVQGKHRGSWYHRYFVRGIMDVLQKFTRVQMLAAMEHWVPPEDFLDTTVLRDPVYGTTRDAGNNDNILANHHSWTTTTTTTKPSKKLRGVVVEDLREMLKDVEMNDELDIVSWQPHGLAFKIHKKNEFETKIMPRYFKTTKLGHLLDSLRIWGFRRLKTKGRDKGAYYHKFFVRDQAFLSRQLSRQQMKESMKDWPGKEGGEPNLYTTPQQQQQQQQQQHSMTLWQETVHANNTVRRRQGLEENTNRLTPVSMIPAMNGPSTDPIHFWNSPVAAMNQSQLEQQQPLSVTHMMNLPPTQQLATNALQHNTTTSVIQDVQSYKTADATYVLRIHEMLDSAEREGHAHIVSWQPHGRVFRIHKEVEFENEIMPRYFKAKLASFRRWLRSWGFVRMTEGKDRGGWYHRYFVRGMTNLCKDMSRAQMKKAMEGRMPVGDFYNYSMENEASPVLMTRESNPSLNPKKLRGTILESLREMLEECEHDRDQAVTWLPHGCAFMINDQKAFAENILPKYFKAKKYTYFSDTLRIWGFVRLKSRVDKGAYFHRYFIRGRPTLSRHLSRKQMKEAMSSWPLANGEPDLYSPDPERIIQQCFSETKEKPADVEQVETFNKRRAKSSDSIVNTTWV